MALLLRQNAFCQWSTERAIHRTARKRVRKKQISIDHSIITLYYRQIRESRYKWEILELSTNDILDKALLKAKANKRIGAIDAPTYFRIEDKISSLKKLKFTQEYEVWKDNDTYEWMKHKVAAEVGGDE